MHIRWKPQSSGGYILEYMKDESSLESYELDIWTPVKTEDGKVLVVTGYVDNDTSGGFSKLRTPPCEEVEESNPDNPNTEQSSDQS